MKVVVRAMPVLRDNGAFSLNVQEIRPLGKGSLKRSFELLKQKLTVEGLFNSERKRPLPQYPQRVAIISSTKAAGYADFMKISSERWGGVKFVVADVNVQGANAADQAVRAISYFNQMPNHFSLIRKQYKQLPKSSVLLEASDDWTNLENRPACQQKTLRLSSTSSLVASCPRLRFLPMY